MKLYKFLILLCCSGIMTFNSCKHNDNETYTMDNQEFINKTVSSIDFKIAAGNMAGAATQSETIKTYTERMTAAQNEMRTALVNLSGKGKSWTVAATAIGIEEKEQLNLLYALEGEIFDQEFSRMMVSAHQNDVGLFVSASVPGGLADKELRDFAAVKLPELRARLDEAQNLQHQN